MEILQWNASGVSRVYQDILVIGKKGKSECIISESVL